MKSNQGIRSMFYCSNFTSAFTQRCAPQLCELSSINSWCKFLCSHISPAVGIPEKVLSLTSTLCKPPIITTWFCSITVVVWPSPSNILGHCIEKSKNETGICPGFRNAVACCWIVMPCFTIAGVAAFS